VKTLLEILRLVRGIVQRFSAWRKRRRESKRREKEAEYRERIRRLMK